LKVSACAPWQSAPRAMAKRSLDDFIVFLLDWFPREFEFFLIDRFRSQEGVYQISGKLESLAPRSSIPEKTCLARRD
jgi:glutamine synthetase